MGLRMLSNEQGVADKFNRYLRDMGERKGITVHDFSLGGQDRHAGADYLLSDSSRFALVEFKFVEANIRDEIRKSRRLKLCQKLQVQPDMRQLHDLCHFVAWYDKPTLCVFTNVYRREVCNQRMFGSNSNLHDISSDPSLRATAQNFAQEFLDTQSHNRSLNLQEFEIYLAWLLQTTSGASASSVELLTSDPLKEGELALVWFPSVEEAYRWMQEHKPKPAPADDNESRPTFR